MRAGFIARAQAAWKALKGAPAEENYTPEQREERRRLREEQEAFRRIQNYTVEDAYGLNLVKEAEG